MSSKNSVPAVLAQRRLTQRPMYRPRLTVLLVSKARGPKLRAVHSHSAKRTH
jgi:hypothetical protein